MIEQLADDGQVRERFLRHSSVHGTLLALSIAGGPTQETIPAATRDADWDALTDHLHALLPDLDENEPSPFSRRSRRPPMGLRTSSYAALARAVLSRCAEQWDSRRRPIRFPLSKRGWR